MYPSAEISYAKLHFYNVKQYLFIEKLHYFLFSLIFFAKIFA